MTSNKQLVLLGFILLGVAAVVFLAKVLGSFWGYFNWYDYPLLGENFTLSTLVVLGVVTGVGVWLGRREDVWMVSSEIVVELKKVTWPNIRPWFSMKSEVWAGAYVVIVTVIIFAVILGVFDFFWSWMTSHIYG